MVSEYPERIYLQSKCDLHPGEVTSFSDSTTWCQDKINDDDVEYIRADQVTEKDRIIAQLRASIEELTG